MQNEVKKLKGNGLGKQPCAIANLASSFRIFNITLVLDSMIFINPKLAASCCPVLMAQTYGSPSPVVSDQNHAAEISAFVEPYLEKNLGENIFSVKISKNKDDKNHPTWSRNEA